MMNPTDAVVAQGLRLSAQALAVLADDTANWATPGFRARVLAWQGALARAVPQGPAAVARVTGRVTAWPGRTRPDQASTSLSALMAQVAMTQATYDLAAEGWQIRHQAVQTAAQGVP